MRITFVVFSLGSGGAERVVSIMANHWTGRGWLVRILTFDDGKIAPFYELAPGVERVGLDIVAESANFRRSMLNNLRRVRILRAALQRHESDAIISFIDVTNVLTLLAGIGLRLPIVVSERVDPAVCRIGRAWSALRRMLYPRAAALVVQTRAALDFFAVRVQRRAWIIPNPIFSLASVKPKAVRSKASRIVAVGRLTYQKGFDWLLEAFALAGANHPDWSLTIWGEGEARADLEALRDSLRLRERVHFPGRTTDILEKLQEGDLFVLSSRFEGFPNALCEAMACGLPVISFDCPSGPSDIVRHKIDGLLVPGGDVAGMAQAIERLMCSEAERVSLSQRAPEILQRFGVEPVMAQWEEMLTKVGLKRYERNCDRD